MDRRMGQHTAPAPVHDLLCMKQLSKNNKAELAIHCEGRSHEMGPAWFQFPRNIRIVLVIVEAVRYHALIARKDRIYVEMACLHRPRIPVSNVTTRLGLESSVLKWIEIDQRSGRLRTIQINCLIRSEFNHVYTDAYIIKMRKVHK